MGIPRRKLKNDVDIRLTNFVAGVQVFLPERDVQRLTRSNLDYWIQELMKGEASLRRLRKRLEALRAGSSRSCPVCTRPVSGRADAVYCESGCRVRAFREARKA